jgi:histidine triad (HIT) family protein
MLAAIVGHLLGSGGLLSPVQTGDCVKTHRGLTEISRRRYGGVVSCLFCDIVAGTVDAEIILEDKHCVGFLDHRPVFKGHVLLVPRLHIVTLPELPAELRDPFLAAGQRLAKAMVDGLGAQGSFVAMNNTVSQSVAHLHLHVVPRTKGDGLRGFFWPRTRYRDGEAAVFASRLVGALSGTG